MSKKRRDHSSHDKKEATKINSEDLYRLKYILSRKEYLQLQKQNLDLQKKIVELQLELSTLKTEKMENEISDDYQTAVDEIQHEYSIDLTKDSINLDDGSINRIGADIPDRAIEEAANE